MVRAVVPACGRIHSFVALSLVPPSFPRLVPDIGPYATECSTVELCSSCNTSPDFLPAITLNEAFFTVHALTSSS